MTKKLHELLAQRDKLNAEIAEAREHERAEALMTVLTLIKDFEFTSKDLQVKISTLPTPKLKREHKTFAVKKPKKVIPPKYVDPASGKTWSGRGHQPGWIVGNRDDYLIKNPKAVKHAAKKRATQNNKHEKV